MLSSRLPFCSPLPVWNTDCLIIVCQYGQVILVQILLFFITGKSNETGTTVEESNSPYFISNTPKPLLSESESSDEEMSIADVKKTVIATRRTDSNKAVGTKDNAQQIEVKTGKVEKAVKNKPAAINLESSKGISIQENEKAVKEAVKGMPQIKSKTIKVEKIVQSKLAGKDFESPKVKRIKQSERGAKETPKSISNCPAGTKNAEKARSTRTIKKGKQTDQFENIELQIQHFEKAKSIESATRGKKNGSVKREKGKTINVETNMAWEEAEMKRYNVQMDVKCEIETYAKKGVTKKGDKGQENKKNNKEPPKNKGRTEKQTIKKEIPKGKKGKSGSFDKELVESRPGPSGVKTEMDSGTSDDSDSENDWEDVHGMSFSQITCLLLVSPGNLVIKALYACFHQPNSVNVLFSTHDSILRVLLYKL